MISGAIPFQIPAQYLASVNAGEMLRYGTILKNASDGKIVAHLQQTGVFDHVLSNSMSGLSHLTQAVANPVGALSSIATVVQNQQIKGQLANMTEMMGSLQTLGLVSSVASVAGIGVSVASTAILLQRIKTVDAGIGRLEGQVAGIADHLNKVDIHKSLRRVEDTMEKLAEAPFRKSEAGTAKVLEDVEENLRAGFNELIDGARVVISLEVLDEELLRTLIAGLATCSAAQTKPLVWLDEMPLSVTRAQNHAQKLNDLARLMPADQMVAKLKGDSEAAARLSTDMRELRAVAASRPSFTERLIELEVSGPDYLTQVNERDDNALLVLSQN